MRRRTFLSLPTAALAAEDLEKKRVVDAASEFLKKAPATVTSARAGRSAGGPHDFFSEGDYWWPDPKNPDGPYIQRDGMTNPDNFVLHRELLMRLSVEVPALAAAYRLAHREEFAEHAAKHLRAWFVSPETRMNPNLQYAQAIKGRVTGRGVGIIDTIHLVEVTKAIPIVKPALSGPEYRDVLAWFRDYLTWMTTHPYGKDERDSKNNHATCWNMQAAAFALLTGNSELIQFTSKRWEEVLLPSQMAPDGSFPQELRRTKPYGYSLFNLDAMATTCELLGLWQYETPDGRGMKKGVEYMAPFIADKSKWPLAPDVMYFDQWPMRQPALLFAGRAYKRQDWLDLWKRLRPDSQVMEVIRNWFVRQPALWTE